MNKTIAILISAALLVLGVSMPVAAGGKDMLLCLPGFPGTTAQAQPYIDKMLRHLEKKLGIEAGSMNGVFISDEVKSVSELKQTRPGLALVGPSVLASQHKAMKMKVIGKLIINGKSEEAYSLVTKKGGPSDVASLAGKTVSGTVVNDPKFVANVLLDKKVPADKMVLVSQRRPLKSLRDVARGKVDAAIVDSSVVAHMKELDFASDLQVIHTSKPVPAPAIVVMGEGPAPAKKIKAELVGMCGRADGKDLCKTLTISAIKAASSADYKSLFARYGK